VAKTDRPTPFHYRTVGRATAVNPHPWSVLNGSLNILQKGLALSETEIGPYINFDLVIFSPSRNFTTSVSSDNLKSSSANSNEWASFDIDEHGA
jgi:hypothetical protein